MLISTLLPTFAHLVIAVFAFVTMWPEWLRRYVARTLDDAGRTGDATSGKWGGLLLALMVGFSVWLPLKVLWYGGVLVTTHYGGVGLALIIVFEWWAGAIGAI